MNIKKILKKHWIITLLLVVFLSFSFQSKFFEIAKQIEIYTTLYKELNLYYVDEINPAEFTNKAIKNTLEDLDPYTNYFDEQEVEEARIRREGEYAGIGVSVYYSDKGIILREIYKGFEADKKGLKAGDVITKIDGQELQNMEEDQLSELLKGAPNTTFSLEYERQGKRNSLMISREKVEYNPVPFYDMIDDETGFITLTRFNAKASSEVKKAFLDLKKRGMKQLVFDLRSNPGGSLGEAISISNFFLPKGSVIVSTRAKIKKWSNTYKATNDPLDLDMPITVLINRRSASASEIVSGAIQDYDRGVLVGERSFGKGLVQRYRELNYGTQLKLTISKYYTPSGRCIQELDYANRKEDGSVPKFSDREINRFTTQNGRIVFDGGGVSPDLEVGYQKLSKTTEELLNSRAIFDFVTDFYHKNRDLNVYSFQFGSDHFNQFINYLVKNDNVFVSSEEKLFVDAYKKNNHQQKIEKQYIGLKKRLQQETIADIKENQDYLEVYIQDEIVSRYIYKEGVYKRKLKKDKVIKAAVDILNDSNSYSKILNN